MRNPSHFFALVSTGNYSIYSSNSLKSYFAQVLKSNDGSCVAKIYSTKDCNSSFTYNFLKMLKVRVVVREN